MVQVENKGNPVYMGKTLCNRGRVTPVSKKDFKEFCESPSGAALFNTTIFIDDADLKKKRASELEGIKSQAMAEARKELGPVIEKEIEKKLKKKIGESFKSIEKKVEDLVKEKEGFELQIKSLNGQIDELKKGGAGSDTSDITEPEKPFEFDPENHIITHRGGGKYFVMDLEDKKVLDRPLTEEERTKFESMIKSE